MNDKPENEGLILGMPSDEYHAHPSMSNSLLSMVNRDENLPEWVKNCPVDEEKLTTFNFGDAMHAICLEPDRLKSDFVVMPELNLRTNAGKAEKVEFIEANAGKSILTFDEYKKLKLMFESVMAHPAARKIIETDGIAEGSFFFKHEETGVNCRVRPDKFFEEEGFLADVKTTPDLAKFMYSVKDYRYFVQNAFYCDGVKACGYEAEHMKFLAIQSTISMGRYPTMVVTLPKKVVDYGRKIYEADLRKHAEFIENGKPIDSHELELAYGFLNEIADYELEIR